MRADEKLILAVPKGRILREVMPVIRRAGIEPEPAFEDEDSRQLRFVTNLPEIDLIRVRSFDVATFVAFGAAHLGVCGNDVLAEFDYSEIYAPLDLRVGHCRMAVAELAELSRRRRSGDLEPHPHRHQVPDDDQRHFAARGVQAECVHLNGAMELAPTLGLCRDIVDLVSSGATLAANGLVEVETIAEITSRLAVNRSAWKTRQREISRLDRPLPRGSRCRCGLSAPRPGLRRRLRGDAGGEARARRRRRAPRSPRSSPTCAPAAMPR